MGAEVCQLSNLPMKGPPWLRHSVITIAIPLSSYSSGRRVCEGGDWGKEASPAAQHPELASWVSHGSPELVAPPLSLFHTQPKTSYHVTSPWELGPNSPHGKPAGPVCWDEIIPGDLVYGCLPTALHLPQCPAQQGDLGSLLTFLSSGAREGKGPLGGAGHGGSGENTQAFKGVSTQCPPDLARQSRALERAAGRGSFSED